jgi:hypothetical protein
MKIKTFEHFKGCKKNKEQEESCPANYSAPPNSKGIIKYTLGSILF